jgi:L-2-hydroxycarboxylate dehydrogenase (NAD+)
MQITIDELRRKVLSTLSSKLPLDQAEKITEYLLWAEMSGLKTQGILKMTGTEPIQNITAKYALRIERDTKLSQLIDGGANPAPVAFRTATEVAIEKAQQSGFAIVGVHNTFSSIGALAFYVEIIARSDLIGIVMARSPGSTAPFNSIDPLFGTNPIAFSFPTNKEPLLFDMATSALTWYGLVLAKAKGEPIPEGVAIDSTGSITRDPALAMKGALLPFDKNYKGSGLGMVVEIMSGPLLGAAYCDCKTFDQEWGSTVIALDPSLLVDTEKFKDGCSDLIRIVKTSRTSDGQPARLPGERAQAAYQEALKIGRVDIDEAILKELGYI